MKVREGIVQVMEIELIKLRNILANVYMDSSGHNDLIAEEAKHGLDLTIKILEEYNGTSRD